VVHSGASQGTDGQSTGQAQRSEGLEPPQTLREKELTCCYLELYFCHRRYLHEESYNRWWRRKEPATDHEKARIVSRDPEIVSGALVFAGTRVPVKNLNDYLMAGHYSLDDFPGVSREQAEGYLNMALEAVEENMRAGAAR